MNGISESVLFVWSKLLWGLFAHNDLLTWAAPEPESLFSVTFCRQIKSNSVFLSATEDKIKRQHHLFILACSSFKRDAKHDETQKGRTPRRAISAKTARTHDAPGLLKDRPQFYLLPCYFCIRAEFFFFSFCHEKNVFLPLCSQTALNSKWQGDAAARGLCGENQLTTPNENEAQSSGKIWNGRENQTISK